MRPLLILLVSLFCPFAAAATSSAREQVQQGLVAYDLGRFPEALERFSEAYRLDPRPAFLFNIAQCHRHLGHWEKAAFFYRRYRSHFAGSAHDAMIVELIAEVEQKLAEAPNAPGAIAARVLMGADEMADGPRHARGFANAASTPTAAHLDALPSSAAAAIPAEVIRTDDPLTQRWWFWAAIGTAAVAAGAGVYAATAPDPRSSTLGTMDFR